MATNLRVRTGATRLRCRPCLLSGKIYCALCQLHVGRTSKHCRECDRCVHGFDHHCKWLNNCVGAANYAEFLWLLRMLVLLTLFHIVASCVALWRAVAHANHAESVSHDGLGSAELIALAAIMALVDMSALYLVGDLLSFHVVLMRVGLTTYEYIMRNRDEGRAAAVRARAPCVGTPAIHVHACMRSMAWRARALVGVWARVACCCTSMLLCVSAFLRLTCVLARWIRVAHDDARDVRVFSFPTCAARHRTPRRRTGSMPRRA